MNPIHVSYPCVPSTRPIHLSYPLLACSNQQVEPRAQNGAKCSMMGETHPRIAYGNTQGGLTMQIAPVGFDPTQLTLVELGPTPLRALGQNVQSRAHESTRSISLFQSGPSNSSGVFLSRPSNFIWWDATHEMVTKWLCMDVGSKMILETLVSKHQRQKTSDAEQYQNTFCTTNGAFIAQWQSVSLVN